jgi:signal-transduction protein with cAMP-binding, CBS, and nucleotidyltransferase domain
MLAEFGWRFPRAVIGLMGRGIPATGWRRKMSDPAQGGGRPTKPPEGRSPDSGQASSSSLEEFIQNLQGPYMFFSDMEEGEISTLLGFCRTESYEKGSVIFHEEDVGANFYFVVSGEIAISKRGKELARLGPGQVFGEMALLERTSRTATASATDSSTLLSIPAKAMSVEMPTLALKLALAIARQLSERLREAEEFILLS